MAKSKLIQANRKIEETVTRGYKKMEHSVVSAFEKVEDKFVGQYLTHDGESVEAAKKRLQKIKNERRQK